MGLLDQIKAAHGERFKEFDVPEWGVKVRAKRIGVHDFIALQADRQQGGDHEFCVGMVSRSLVNENDSLLFDDSNRYLLTEGHGLVVTPRLARELAEWNKVAGGVEDHEKNSVSNPS